MNKTKIEWADYTWNPITGCKNTCTFCYARKIATRFKGTKAFPNGFEPTFYPERLYEPYRIKKKSKIFVCSMGEMFGFWVTSSWITESIRTMSYNPHHIFQILTKFPYQASYFNFPPNVWLGVSITDNTQLHFINELKRANARIKFISFEPLLSSMQDPIYNNYNMLRYGLEGIDWVIIGAQTNPLKIPEEEWIRRIVVYCSERNIPIFTKNNLFEGSGGWSKKIQDFPKKLTNANNQ